MYNSHFLIDLCIKELLLGVDTNHSMEMGENGVYIVTDVEDE